MEADAAGRAFPELPAGGESWRMRRAQVDARLGGGGSANYSSRSGSKNQRKDENDEWMRKWRIECKII